MDEPAADVSRELATLEAELKRLEAEYNMFFAGRLPRPPWDTRNRVSALVKRLDRARLSNYADRFRFSTLQSRFATFVELWDRGQRAREEGRSGPLGPPRQSVAAAPATDRVVHVATFSDPAHESDKLRSLYANLIEARREIGQEQVPFQRFAELVTTQVRAMQQSGCLEVAFRVTVKDGKVAFTARGLRTAKNDE